MMATYRECVPETTLDSEMAFRKAYKLAPENESGLFPTDPTMERKMKHVSFRESENVVAYISQSNDSSVWYSEEEISEMKKWVEMASMGVTDACGDVDVFDRIAEYRGAVLEAQRQSQDLDRLSAFHSEESVKVARLYAIILAQDVSMEGNPVTKEALCDIICRAIVDGEDDNCSLDETSHLCIDEAIGDDNDSIGTIDEWPLEMSDPIEDASDINAIQSFRREGPHQSSVTVELDEESLFTTSRESFQPSNTGATQIASTVENEVTDEKLVDHSDRPIIGPCHGANQTSQLSSRRKLVCHINRRNMGKLSVSDVSGVSRASDFLKPESPSKGPRDAHPHGVSVSRRCGLSEGDAKRTMTGKRSRATCKEQFSAMSPCSKRPYRGPSAPTGSKQNTDFGPHVAQALITLARWEFRSCHLPLQS